ncbi:hydroxyisourate hydrolase [soil metagenome]
MSAAVGISTHVLDTSFGAPAVGVAVTLERMQEGGHASAVSRGVTDADGRVMALAPRDSAVAPGAYRICFHVADYFAATQRTSFYNDICVNFVVANEPQHYHVPLLLSPFGYSTYRGS